MFTASYTFKVKKCLFFFFFFGRAERPTSKLAVYLLNYNYCNKRCPMNVRSNLRGRGKNGLQEI